MHVPSNKQQKHKRTGTRRRAITTERGVAGRTHATTEAAGSIGARRAWVTAAVGRGTFIDVCAGGGAGTRIPGGA